MVNRILYVAAVLLVTLVGCDEQKPTATAASAASEDSSRTLPSNLRLASAPADAKGVAETRTSAKNGQRVIVRGVVAGRAEPIAANRAILTLLDSSIKTCDANPSDSCKTPWDACCEPADVLAKNSVTVQVVDKDGRPLKTALTALDGVKPLAKLTVTGMATQSSDGVTIVNADGIFVQ